VQRGALRWRALGLLLQGGFPEVICAIACLFLTPSETTELCQAIGAAKPNSEEKIAYW